MEESKQNDDILMYIGSIGVYQVGSVSRIHDKW